MDTKKRTVRRKKTGHQPTDTQNSEVKAIPAPEKPQPVAAKAAPKSTKKTPPMDLSGLEALAKGEGFDMASVMDDVITATNKREVGDRVKGSVTRVGTEALLIHIGGKMEATADRAEWPDAVIGTEIDAFIIDIHSDEVRLSKRLAGAAAAAMLETAMEDGIPVEGIVRSKNSGGFEVVVGKTRTFCPMSQIHRLPGTDPELWVGQTLSFKVIETGDKIVVSRRALQEEQLVEATQSFWQTAEIGLVVAGVVTSVHEWGAYIDMDGVDGRIHKRDMSWDGETDPLGLLVRGQGISAQITSIEPEHQRVSLSLKHLQDDPWELLGTQFAVGCEYTGRVTRVETYGAFVQLSPGLVGLVHVSNFRNAGIATPSSGTDITVVLRAVDPARRRLDLGLPGVENAPADRQISGTVSEIMRNGIVVLLDDGGTGWLPASEAPLPPGTLLAQRFRRGRPITARILDSNGSRLTLTMKERVDESAWKSDAPQDNGSLGTFADLFAAAKKKS